MFGGKIGRVFVVLLLYISIATPQYAMGNEQQALLWVNQQLSEEGQKYASAPPTEKLDYLRKRFDLLVSGVKWRPFSFQDVTRAVMSLD